MVEVGVMYSSHNEIEMNIQIEDNPLQQTNQTAVLDNDYEQLAHEIDEYHIIKNKENRQIRFRFLKLIYHRNREMNGWKKMMKHYQDDDADKRTIQDIVAFKYSSDTSYLRRSSPEEVWDAIRRRYVWKKYPFKMIFLTITQILVCTVVTISQNSHVNVSTLLMASMYIVAIGVMNPLSVTMDLEKYIRLFKQKSNLSPVVFGILVALLSPVLLVVFGVTFTLDLIVGEILDLSLGSMINILVNVIVVFTAISVGLRSGNPINAIQTFAGFDFINSMDEMVIESIDIDMKELQGDELEYGDSNKILFVRVTIYILTPSIIAFFIYITVTNSCLAFCTETLI